VGSKTLKTIPTFLRFSLQLRAVKRTVIPLIRGDMRVHANNRKSFIFPAKHLDMVIDLGMGKGSGKSKPLTKKERAARRKKRKDNRPK